jgi:hypothetical protein
VNSNAIDRGLFASILAGAWAAGAAAMAQPAMDHSSHDMGAMGAMEHAGHDMGAMPATGNLGAYPMTRDASGTSWQPDASSHEGLHAAMNGWSLMGHATFNLVSDRQYGTAGGKKTFLGGMVMGAARRDIADGTLNLRVMLSPEPLMGPRGYPLLLAAGETADGMTPLVDRQHPHDLFMELSASYSRRFGGGSAFLYAGLPGEPAFGPPAFMHRLSASDSPEAPITHHWLDSTHITFGVLTAGWVGRNWKLEASAFTGREPDQHRYDIETPKLDSSAVRLSWNPGPRWSLQVSRAELKSPEALAPSFDEDRWSASAIYTRPIGTRGLWSTTAAWGHKRRTGGTSSQALSLDTAFKPNPDWTLFARAERLVDTDEFDFLVVPGGHIHAGPILPGHTHSGVQATVAKYAIGVIRDWRVAPHAKFGVGGLASTNTIPANLRLVYGKDPAGRMLFLRLVID